MSSSSPPPPPTPSSNPSPPPSSPTPPPSPPSPATPSPPSSPPPATPSPSSQPPPPSRAAPPPPPPAAQPPTNPPPPPAAQPPTNPPPPPAAQPPTNPPPPPAAQPPTNPPPPPAAQPPTNPPPPPPPSATPPVNPPSPPPPPAPVAPTPSPPPPPTPISPLPPPPAKPPASPPPPPPAAPSPSPPPPPATPAPSSPPPNPKTPPPSPTPPPPPSPTPPAPAPSPPPPSPSPSSPKTPTSSPPPPAATPPTSPPPPWSPPPPPPANSSTSPPQAIYSPPQPGESPPPPSSPNPLSPAVVAGISAGAVVLVVALVGVCFFCWGRRSRPRRRPSAPAPTLAPAPDDPYASWPSQQSIKPPPTPPPVTSWPISSGGGSASYPGSNNQPPLQPLPPILKGHYTYEELAAATNGFSDTNLLGQGGFGHVFKGTLGGTEVAIKKLRTGSRQGDREFRAEVEIISRVHHRNLVSLVGFCIYGDQRLLVYEFVPNKTLEFHLHGTGRPTLDWPRRWKIALGSAKGLAYLHEDCHPKIIHRDIKAANILLDYNFEPKVSDFGLAKFQPEDNTHVSTRVMGTFGYLAPEYATSGKLSDKSDVFSFGVMLLELITGRPPFLSSQTYMDETLVGWARPLLARALEADSYDGLIDLQLEMNYDPYDMARLVACAAAAVRQTAKHRPRMSQIVRYLEGEISLEDLNAGIMPGQSSLQASGQSSGEHIRRLRRMAFGSQDNISSEYSEQTSEYGQNLSTSSSGGETGETEAKVLNKRSRGLSSTGS